MGKMSRDKGKRGERQLAAFLRDEGYDCHRGVQYQGGKDSPDVVGLPLIHIECKFVERLNIYDAMKQSIRDSAEGEKPVVFFKNEATNNKWYVTLRADDFMDIYREWEAGQNV